MNTPEIKTARLTIAAPLHFGLDGHAYLDDLHAIYSDPVISSYLCIPDSWSDRAAVAAIIDEENENWRNEGSGVYLMHDAGQDRIVGIVKLQPSPMEPPRDVEIVYAVHPAFRGQGYAQEGVRAVVDHEFKSGKGRIVARVEHKNLESQRLLVKLGFSRGEDRVVKYLGTTLTESEQVYELVPPLPSAS